MKLKVLTPLKVIKNNGEKYTVLLEGQMNENFQENIVKNSTQNEIYAEFINDKNVTSFNGEKNPYIKIINKFEDDYGDVWYKVSKEINLPKKVLSKKDDLYKKADDIYKNTCSACHRLKNPKDFTVNQWPDAVKSMQKYSGLDNKKQNLIIKFLQQHAKDIKN